MTIQDFAQKIGVSPTTVSRTLRGKGRISEQTRAMVLAQMKELGYTPNLNAQRLIDGRSMTVALDWGSESPASPLMDAYTAELTEGILGALTEQGYGLLLTLHSKREQVESWVRGQVVDGILLIGGGTEAQDMQLAESSLALGAPCVVIGHHTLPLRSGLGTVVIDLASGMIEVVRYLREQGHRRIAFIGSHEGDAGLDAFRAAMASSEIQIADRLRIVPDTARIEATVHALMQAESRPTAIVARTDTYALHVLRAAKRAGWSVPHDLSVVGHDDTALAALWEPALTTVRIDSAQLGQAAATMLLQILNDPETPRGPVICPTSLVRRDTVAPPLSLG